MGTPISNSMCELYTMMRYLQAGMLKDCGIDHFDEWAADFGEVKTDYELEPEFDGKYQLKTRFAKFTNLPELMGMFMSVQIYAQQILLTLKSLMHTSMRWWQSLQRHRKDL